MTRRFICLWLCSFAITAATHADWLGFRGPAATGISAETNLPVSWSEDKNVAWKIDLPGRGLSSPIIVGDSVIVTCCSGPDQDSLHVLCLDADGGKTLWQRRIWSTGRTMCHPKTNMAAPTPVSDGKYIYALFATCDLIGLDLDGNVRWMRSLSLDYPGIGNNVGLAASPAVAAKTLVALIDNDGTSFAIGIDTATGTTRWQVPRERTVNWTSPVIWSDNQGQNPVVLLQGSTGLIAHDLATGAQRWSLAEKCETIPSVTTSGGTMVVPADGLIALRPDPQTDSPNILWRSKQLRPATASPLVLDDRVYTVNSAGVVSCANMSDGERVWQLRLKGPFSASPVAAGGRLYYVNEAGVCQVVEPGEAGKLVGTNAFGEMILASPAVAGGALYFRSDAHLWKISQDG
jgi:outer membrane protein assembly factor BamB